MLGGRISNVHTAIMNVHEKLCWCYICEHTLGKSLSSMYIEEPLMQEVSLETLVCDKLFTFWEYNISKYNCVDSFFLLYAIEIISLSVCLRLL